MTTSVTDYATSAFWDERPMLAHIRDFARARRVSPWATFGGVLARVAAATEPHVQLPALVGGHGSLNTFIGIVGRSGQGKGASQAAATAAVRIERGEPFEVVTVGSGEGIAAAYVERSKGEDGTGMKHHAYSALFDVAEVDTLTSLAGRQGSTLLSELRKVWSGERLGFQNRDASRSLPVESHAYRAALVAGIQPARAGALLDDAAGGTPQRFVWLPATDSTAPDRAPRLPAPITWHAPGEDIIPTRDQHRLIDVCDTARDVIDGAQRARLRGDGDALDGHALFSRLKVAALLGILDERGNVSEDDWRLAGVVMAVSNQTRADCQHEIKRVSQRENLARAEARAEANVHGTEHAEAMALTRVKDRILQKVGTELVSYTAIRRDLTRAQRDYYEEALEQLAASGVIEVVKDIYQEQPRTRIRLARGGTSSAGVAEIPPLPATPELPRNYADLRGGTTGVAETSPLPGNIRRLEAAR